MLLPLASSHPNKNVPLFFTISSGKCRTPMLEFKLNGLDYANLIALQQADIEVRNQDPQSPDMRQWEEYAKLERMLRTSKLVTELAGELLKITVNVVKLVLMVSNSFVHKQHILMVSYLEDIILIIKARPNGAFICRITSTGKRRPH